MRSHHNIWNVYFFALAIIQIPIVGIVFFHWSYTGISWQLSMILCLSLCIAVLFGVNRHRENLRYGPVMLLGHGLMVFAASVQPGLFPSAVVGFLSAPIVLTGIMNNRAGWIVLTIGLALLTVIATLGCFGYFEFDPFGQAALSVPIVWGTFMLCAALSATIAIFVTDALRRSWDAATCDMASQRNEIQGILDNLVDAFFRCDQNNKITLVSESFRRISAIPFVEGQICSLSDIAVEPDKIAVFTDRIRSGDGMNSYSLSTQVQTRHGTVLDADIRAVRRVDEQGRYIGFDGTIHDRTDLLESQKDLAMAVTEKATVAENIPGAVYDVVQLPDGALAVDFLNSRCEEIWELSALDAARNPNALTVNMFEDDKERFQNLIDQSARTMQPIGSRVRLHGPQGTVKHLNIRAKPHLYPNDTLRWHCVAMDVSAEVAAQDDLVRQTAMAEHAQKQESIGQLTGGVAHDFNNLLAVIMGNLELLRDETTNKDHWALIDAGIAATSRGADLVRNMLAFARRAKLEPTILDVNDLIRDAQNWIGRTIPESITVETSLLAGAWKINVDRSSAESALLNLMLNARDAMKGGGRLTLETANVRIDSEYVNDRREDLEPGRYVMLAVSDTGDGIAGRDLNKIFNPFYTTKGPGEGSGLGLSMVQGFMRQSGGAIQVYSEAGVGTTFKLYFKAATGLEVVPTITSSNDPESFDQNPTDNRILLVEDEVDVLVILERTLRKAGYSVVCAESGDRAKEIFEQDDAFDLVITDIVMPGRLQGTTLAQELREMRPNLPFVFMSGYAQEAMVHGNGLRPDDIRLMKPVRRAEILASVEQAIASAPKGEQS